MGKTVPSYRMALEDEIQRWSDFSRALRAEEKEAFDQIMESGLTGFARVCIGGPSGRFSVASF